MSPDEQHAAISAGRRGQIEGWHDDRVPAGRRWSRRCPGTRRRTVLAEPDDPGQGPERRFTVYVPDRRGRGMSGPYRKDHGVRTEIEDLEALLDQTQARNVFGLSAGAVVAIEAARVLPAITRLALYEPPLEFDGITQTSWLPRYEREMAADQPAAALVTIMKGTADRTAFRVVPRFLLTSALSLAIRKTDSKPVPAVVVSPRDLIPTMHYDARTVLDAAGPLDRFAGVSCKVAPARRLQERPEPDRRPRRAQRRAPPRPPGHPARRRSHRRRQQRQARTRRRAAMRLLQLTRRGSPGLARRLPRPVHLRCTSDGPGRETAGQRRI